jgi:hypothetical protein
MRYSKNHLVKRLQESEREFLTEAELLALATPCINSTGQVVETVKHAIDKGFTGDYTVNQMSKITSLSRQTLYRWEDEDIIFRKDNKLNIIELYNTLTLIESRIK